MMKRTLTICCHLCPRLGPSGSVWVGDSGVGGLSSDIRARARKEGWKRVPNRSTGRHHLYDLCPECAKKVRCIEQGRAPQTPSSASGGKFSIHHPTYVERDEVTP